MSKKYNKLKHNPVDVLNVIDQQSQPTTQPTTSGDVSVDIIDNIFGDSNMVETPTPTPGDDSVEHTIDGIFGDSNMVETPIDVKNIDQSLWSMQDDKARSIVDPAKPDGDRVVKTPWGFKHKQSQYDPSYIQNIFGDYKYPPNPFGIGYTPDPFGPGYAPNHFQQFNDNIQRNHMKNQFLQYLKSLNFLETRDDETINMLLNEFTMNELLTISSTTINSSVEMLKKYVKCIEKIIEIKNK